jgi:hypothetical protein
MITIAPECSSSVLSLFRDVFPVYRITHSFRFLQLYTRSLSPTKVCLVTSFQQQFSFISKLVAIISKMSQPKSSKPNIVFGAALINSITPDALNSVLKTLEKHSVKELDTARIYVRSNILQHFTID